MTTPETRPWSLVGPWYRWDQPSDPASGRSARPVFQKYDTAQFVNEFLKDPQHSLRFNEFLTDSQNAHRFKDDDHVFDVVPKPAPPGLSPSLFRFDYKPSGVRKLYLHTHKRFYLVVCELHCDSPGFPTEDRARVCEAGFVVRRRQVVVPEITRELIQPILTEMAAVREPLINLDAGTPWSVRKKLGSSATTRYQDRYEALLESATKLGVVLQLQGWVPSAEFATVGDWVEVPEAPAIVTGETIFPLYPLIPDPRDKAHSARGRSIYFGVVPVGGAEVNPFGAPRFDDVSLYEIRCFVRRHKPHCPKTGKRNDCHGELVWSRRTESYRLASHFDLTGTSQQPVTIQMPDLPALEAQTARLPPGAGCPVRMVWPAGSALDFSVDSSGKPKKKGPPGKAICSFAIPLITIVASFVLQLFLPIVIFVFQLYWLLALKFCIPPSLSLDAGLAADLNTRLPEFDIDASLQVKLDAQLNVDLGELNAEFAAAAKADLEASFTPGALAGFVKGVSADFSPDARNNPNAIAGDLPAVTAGLEYEAHVEVRAS